LSPEPEPELEPDPDPFDEPEALEESEDPADFAASDVAGELSGEDPLALLAAPSLPTATALDPFRLSVR